MCQRRRVDRLIPCARNRGARRRIFLTQRVVAAVHMQRHNRQPGEHNTEIRVLGICIRQQLIAVSFTDRVCSVVIAVVVDPRNAQVLLAHRRLRIQLQLRPIIASVHARRAVEGLARAVIAQLRKAVAHANHQRLFPAFLARVLNGPCVLQLNHRLDRRLRLILRADCQQIEHRLNH